MLEKEATSQEPWEARVGAEPRPFLVASLRCGAKKKGPLRRPIPLESTLDNRKGLSLRDPPSARIGKPCVLNNRRLGVKALSVFLTHNHQAAVDAEGTLVKSTIVCPYV